MVSAQIAAVAIFLVMFLLLVLEKFPRHLVTLVCGLATLVIVFGICMHDPAAVAESLSFQSFLSPTFWYSLGEVETTTGINWETILFIAGMMIMVEGMAKSGFFRWLCIRLARMVHFKPAPLFILFMILSAALSMFIDSITVIMFLAAVTAELARLMGLSPTPLILAEIFCANLGGSATMCGDPPNIIIGASLGYSFFDFITNTGLIALAALVLVVPYFYFFFRKHLVPAFPQGESPVSFPQPREAITSKRSFLLSCLIFAAAVVLLITHAQTGLTVATIGVVIGVVTLLAAGKTPPAFCGGWTTPRCCSSSACSLQ